MAEKKPQHTLQELEEENELLLLQLHQVQEELERYYLRNKELEKSVDSAGGSLSWVSEDLPEVLAENKRLQTLVQVQKNIHELETENALHAKLGNLLIDVADSPSKIFSTPGKLLRIWRQTAKQTPPKALGGQEFSSLITAYDHGGIPQVEQVLASQSLAASMEANGWTALARYLMPKDPHQAAQVARRAHGLDPKPFRLKWLVFRLHDAGELAEAEAMLDLLPEEINFSDSEARQIQQLRFEAEQKRRQEAKEETNFYARQRAVQEELQGKDKELQAASSKLDRKSVV